MAAALLAAATGTARAHSLDEVETMLAGQEQYFQVVERPAPDFTLRTADGLVARLADFRGKAIVLNFIYTSCPDVCPLHAEAIAEVQRLVDDTPMKERVAFISVTTDPTNDTPEAMREYGPTHGLDPANWTFLTTTSDEAEDATRALAKAYGHKFEKTDDGYQMHGIVTHVIDRQGVWKANFHGLRFDPVNLVTFVNALTNDTTRPHPHPAKGRWQWITE
ncbi:SCO family protein [Mesorhizobium sp. LHD-90]|uniref:SCO family protein n=1 Tax=Mesorhizobium sp. LHD-90 TaxID=3071414 RepID=UPI0027E1E624|nr:SCO family protein [Mesorhizobium sp. LHD-90]MDQ6437728.1 SCO family protein [Mesorhizobium sp. LHD-90]